MGVDTVIKVSGAIAANAVQNDIASIDIPEDGEIMCIGGLIMGNLDDAAGVLIINDSYQLSAELSFLSTNQIGANDARGTIAGIGVTAASFFGEAAETGGGGFKLSEQASICIEGGLKVNAGERIHLHGSSNRPTLLAVATFLLYIRTRGGGRRAPKRR